MAIAHFQRIIYITHGLGKSFETYLFDSKPIFMIRNYNLNYFGDENTRL
jgi:hypothetical protein